MQNLNTNSNNFNFEEVFRAGLATFKKEWKQMIILFIAYIVATLPLEILNTIWEFRLYENKMVFSEFLNEEVLTPVWVAGTSETVLYVLFTILSLLWSFIIAFNLAKIYFKIFDGHKSKFLDIFVLPNNDNKNLSQMGNYFLAALAYGILVILGLILLIIPGIYFALRYLFALNLILDKNMKVLEAFEMSAKMTEGIKWKLLGFGLTQFIISIGIILVGIVCLIVGIIPAIFFVICWCIFTGIFLYRKLYKVHKGEVASL